MEISITQHVSISLLYWACFLHFFLNILTNSIFGPMARKAFFSHEMRVRKQEHSPTRALRSGFLHEALRPSLEINGMQSPELKNVRFPHGIFDSFFHGTKALGHSLCLKLSHFKLSRFQNFNLTKCFIYLN